MFTAEFAIFHHFNTIRIVLFILVRLIVALLQSVQAKVMALRIRIHLALYLLICLLYSKNARLHTKKLYHT